VIEQTFIGLRLPPFTTSVDRDRVHRFAIVIGENDPVFHDLTAARAAGYPDIPLPPTLLFSAELDRPGEGVLELLGVTVERVMHSEQRFTYHAPAHANEELTFATTVTDLYTRLGRTFLVQETAITRDGEPVADLRQVLMVSAAEVAS
jgi:acyl dehydratase